MKLHNASVPVRKLPFGLFFAWLTMVFLVGLALRFHANLGASEKQESGMLLAERLALLSKFSPDLSPAAREQLLSAALAMESDPDRKAIMEGRLVEPKNDLRGGIRLMSEYLREQNSEKKRELEAAAKAASERLILCATFFAALLSCALVWSFLSPHRSERAPQAMSSLSPARQLSLFFGWDVLNLFVVGTLTALVAKALPPLASLVLAQLTGYGLLLVLLWRVRPATWNLRRAFSLTWVGRGYFLCYLLVFLTNTLIGAVTGTQPTSKNPLVGLFLEGSTWQVAVLGVLVVFVGPFFEELLFRGWLLGGLRRHWGDKRALLVSAGLFAIIHADPGATPALFMLGLVFGGVYLRAGSLWACILLHSMWNATTFTFLLSNMP